MQTGRKKLAAIFMKLGSLVAVTLLLSTLSSITQTNQPNPAMIPTKKEKFHLYLLMGQSNMAGRGDIGPEDKITHPRVLVFTTNNVWEPAVEPITHDRARDLGVGPGFSFAKVMAEKNPDVTIGLVPCAVGGTRLERWQKGGDLYERALVRARAAMKDGTLRGVLWHQGESDTTVRSLADSYGERLGKMIVDFRGELGLKSLPFVVGELGEFLYDRAEGKTPSARLVNDALDRIPDQVPFTACVKSKGLTHKGDQLHFNSASQHEFGHRYADAMIQLESSTAK